MSEQKKYWWFQAAGWGGLSVFSLVIASFFKYINIDYLVSFTFTILVGLICSHFMRMVIKQYNVFAKPITKQIYFFILITILFSFIYSVISESIDVYVLDYGSENMRKYSFIVRVGLGMINAIWIFLLWNVIYFTYHYLAQTRKREIDTLRLEALVRTLELKTIKAHINPHFIFNSLNGIRALVDENPERARKAITELSNILRSSLKAEQNETVPLHEELKIVKDYLALEQMRFEERLNVQFNIDEQTLNLPVPHMMIQTLAENAVKHGISKEMKGGVIQLNSFIENGNHVFQIKNTGRLNGQKTHQGFGIKSTIDRLNILYHGKANFEILDTDDKMVESKFSIPL